MDAYKIIIVNVDNTSIELPAGVQIENLTIYTGKFAKNNVIKLYSPFKFKAGCSLDLRGNGAEISLGASQYVYDFIVMTATNVSNQKLIVGNNVSMADKVKFYLTEENAQIIIGNDCMFSSDVEIWASDGHTLIDCESGKVINKCTDSVMIGNHVWVGVGATILKNGFVSDNSIIGAKSVVTRKFTERNIVIAGNPARKVKENIDWDRRKPLEYEMN